MILRKDVRSKYTIIDNEPIQSPELSLKARGMLVTLLSFPDDWHFNQRGLYGFMTDREASVKSALDELESKGYLTRTRSKRSDGTFEDWEWTVRESPHLGFPELGFPELGFPHLGFPELQNTKEQSTKLQSTKGNLSSGKPDRSAEIAEIVEYLNSKLGTSYRTNSKDTASKINARLGEGFTVDDFKAVIDSKASQWGNDSRMQEYLRPKTLFAQSNFEGYLQAAKKKEVRANAYSEYD